jgi:hypothetical protein
MDTEKVLQSLLGQEKRVSDVEKELKSLDAFVTQTKAGVRKIEQELHRPKSTQEKFKELAGVISLVLGLIISGFTIYESAYKKPSEARDLRREVVRTGIVAIMSAQQEVQKAEFERRPPNLVSTAAGNLAYYTQLVESLTAREPDLTGFPEEMVLAQASRDTGSPENEIKHLRKAQRMASTPSEKVQAEIALAESGCMTGKLSLDESRRGFSNAKLSAGQVEGAPGKLLTTNVLGAESLCECRYGNQKEAATLYQQFVDLMNAVKSLPGAPDSMQLDGQILGLQKTLEFGKCPQSTPPKVESK